MYAMLSPFAEVVGGDAARRVGGLRVALVASAAMGGGRAADGRKESKNRYAPRRRLDDERPYREADEQADEEEQRLSVRTLLDAALMPIIG